MPMWPATGCWFGLATSGERHPASTAAGPTRRPLRDPGPAASHVDLREPTVGNSAHGARRDRPLPGGVGRATAKHARGAASIDHGAGTRSGAVHLVRHAGVQGAGQDGRRIRCIQEAPELPAPQRIGARDARRRRRALRDLQGVAEVRHRQAAPQAPRQEARPHSYTGARFWRRSPGMRRCQDGCCGCWATTIQGVPNRSTHMPKASEKKVGASAWVTLPPSASASKTRLASAVSAAS
jgi:hypothetical protein